MKALLNIILLWGILQVEIYATSRNYVEKNIEMIFHIAELVDVNNDIKIVGISVQYHDVDCHTIMEKSELILWGEMKVIVQGKQSKSDKYK